MLFQAFSEAKCTVPRINGHSKSERTARDSAMGCDSASVMSSELESSSFIDSEEDDDGSRLSSSTEQSSSSQLMRRHRRRRHKGLDCCTYMCQPTTVVIREDCRIVPVHGWWHSGGPLLPQAGHIVEDSTSHSNITCPNRADP
ncbi:hypothetical protein J4Q44_G00258980 [Coregonus suidteri]|uniref:Dishevelled protein domain-containing protein n=1 Tax=Coregonus suidteri TaxID=861788 RepID=A0AAN8KY86_9TELE